MKNIKSSSGNRNRFGLFSFLFLSLFAFCSPLVFAQDKNWRQSLPAERQTETERLADAEILFEENDFADKSEETAKRLFLAPSPTRYGREEHGIVNIAIAQATSETEASEIKSEFFAAPNIKPSADKLFFPPKDARDSFARQSKIDLKANGLASVGKDSAFARKSASANKFDEFEYLPDDSRSPGLQNGKSTEGFRWGPALRQSLLFLAVQHGYAMTQPKTRQALKGRFFRDYVKSVKSLRGWDDGGRFFTNYIAHPMQGSFVGFIQIQNDPKGMKQRFGKSGDYWRSRMKAMAWSAAWSTQFEIGPISQASIGNVGLYGKQTYVDIVMTPTLGTAMLVAEDALDRFVIERIERATDNFYLTIFSRMLLNPTRTVANLIRFKHPWYRDRARAR